MLYNLLIHKGECPASGTVLPERFTNPFSYIPDKFCREAAFCVQQYLMGQRQWHDELQKGKMFGVLVVQTRDGELGYLAAFSGNLQGQNNLDFFVPPVCDLLNPDEFFKVGEREISAINREISALEQSGELEDLQLRIRSVRESMLEKIIGLKENYKRGKMKRKGLRLMNIMGLETGDFNAFAKSGHLAELNRESQFQKAQIKRAEKSLKEALEPLELQLGQLQERIEALKKLRKEKSSALQEKIFESFTFLNALGEEKSLLSVFREYYNDSAVLPPGGAGECAAPKLLQYAYKHGLRPVCMGEFWWGDSPKGEIRRHGEFYPSCKGKCAPILGFMLQGLDVEGPVHIFKDGTAASDADCSGELAVLYDDEWIVAANKPSGILSVPGKDSAQPCVADLLRSRYGYKGDLFPVHRLDMHTSGVLVLAKNALVYKELQRQFAGREVSKCYMAVLDGAVSDGSAGDAVVWDSGVSAVPAVCGASGVVSLPLVPDYNHRPCQRVDFVDGKEAVTRFEIVRIESGFAGRTFVKFYPLTGRTHQLRVHSAHPMGLNAPIVGDLLYGSPAPRLMLHAFSVSFTHPITGAKVEISAPIPPSF